MEENIHENVVAFLLDGGLIEYYQFNGFTFRDGYGISFTYFID